VHYSLKKYQFTKLLISNSGRLSGSVSKWRYPIGECVKIFKDFIKLYIKHLSIRTRLNALDTAQELILPGQTLKVCQ
jgi:hypothetical protein